MLDWAIEQDASDPRAPYYLGNLLYDRRRYAEAIALWRRAARLDPSFPTVHRNLGIAEVNVLGRPGRGLAAYVAPSRPTRPTRACSTSSTSCASAWAMTQRHASAPSARIRRSSHGVTTSASSTSRCWTGPEPTRRRGPPASTLPSLGGGEGLVSRQWWSPIGSSHAALRAATRLAADLVMVAMDYPPNLGEGKHLLTPENELQLLLGQALAADGRPGRARTWLDEQRLPRGTQRTEGRGAVLASHGAATKLRVTMRPKPDSSPLAAARRPPAPRRVSPILRHIAADAPALR